MWKTKSYFLTLALYLATPVILFQAGETLPEWLGFTLGIWLVLVGPVAVIATSRIATEEIDERGPEGFSGKLLRTVVAAPLGIFGLICVVAGLGILGTVLWQALVKQDYTWLASIRGIVIIIAMIGFGGLMIRIALKRTALTREELEAHREKRLESIRHPNWETFQRLLGRPVPPRMIKFLTSHEPDTLIDGLFIFETWETVFTISDFGPVDDDSTFSKTLTGLDYDQLIFAASNAADPVFLKPGASEPYRVYVYYHDGGDVEVLANSVDEFFDRLRLCADTDDSQIP